jgi:hypothetical protein
MNHDTAQDSVPLSSPKGGEGWGEEASGLMGKFHCMFSVRYSRFQIHGEMVLRIQGNVMPALIS